jgi:integrase
VDRNDHDWLQRPWQEGCAKGVRSDETEAKNKLRDLLRDQADGLTAGVSGYTVRLAVEDWLTHGLGRQSAATVTKYRHLCAEHVLPALGARKLRDLSASEVDQWLAGLSRSYSTRTVQEIRACLNRAVKRAMARDQVRRNVVELTDVPTGQPGRRSKSLTPEQVDDVLIKTAPDRLHRYLVVSLLTGARTEELRALRWEHVHLDGRPNAVQSAPAPPFGGVAIGARGRRHEDQEVPAYARAAGACRRGFAEATRSADGGSARGRPSVAGVRAGVHDRTGHPA